MRVRRLRIQNFRGVSDGTVDFSGHTLLVGGNNVGKSTVCEALDLVLGPERLYRRPVIDEHDFHCGRHLDADGNPVEIRITAILVDLSDETRLRLHRHLRRWDDAAGRFADEDGTPEAADQPTVVWALPVVFIGRYDRAEDDFVGNTFFDHPAAAAEDELDAEMRLGDGRKPFTRDHKRLCGFVFLRTIRTGTRALSLQRGSLLDTVLRLGDGGLAAMWTDTLDRLRGLEPAIGDVAQLQTIRTEMRQRLGRFVHLAPGDDAAAFFASDLTRDHLRDVVRLFVAAEPRPHSVPFTRLGTGSINLLVFALLTLIADLKGPRSVIFAMEEPEIALPPHTQRRVVRFVLEKMGQVIVTSHSPYVIEQFDPKQAVMLERAGDGALTGRPVDLDGVARPQTYYQNRRQFGEAILARAVLVVEGATEASLFPIASSVMEQSRPQDTYQHLDVAGVSIFNAEADNAVPRFGPIFKALGKQTFGFCDTPNRPFGADDQAKLALYDRFWQSPEKGIENVLAKQTAVTALRRFLEHVAERPDYPAHCGAPTAAMTEPEVRDLAKAVLKERKGGGFGYAALVIAHCQTEADLPATIREILETVNHALTAPVICAEPGPAPADGAVAEDAAVEGAAAPATEEVLA